MDHQAAPVHQASRPRSAVGHGVGLAGLAGLAVWITIAWLVGMDGPLSALADLAACALPMIGWSLLVDRVHRAPSTGIDWDHPRPRGATREISLTKLAGLWATWAGIALIYATLRLYWEGRFVFAMDVLIVAAPIVFVLSIPYVMWLDRRLVEPRDGAWALGAWLMGLPGWTRAAVADHLRAWAVKAFFLAFMLAALPEGFGALVRTDPAAVVRDPVALANALILLMFTVDLAFGAVGYILTLRPLDAHIRTANPFAAAWAAALICYPPSILMDAGGPLDYHPATADWSWWLAGQPLLLWGWGAVLVALTGVYAWATVAFGIRFSNLTNRGILTHGPYALTRHPAYLAKNLFWWLATIPVLTTGTTVDAARATLLLGVVSGVYYWRAKSEEWHLKQDPAYIAYWNWAATGAPLTRWLGALLGR